MQDSTAVAERAFEVESLFTSALWLNIGLTVLNVVLVLALAWFGLKLIARALRKANRRVEALPPLDPKRQRTHTVTNLVYSFLRYVVWAIALFMVLAELSLDIGPLLAGAGIAGLAIGFGAQTLVKDVIAGIFLLFDDTINVGDSITFSGNTATVEAIGVRLIKARKLDGELMMIPAGDLRIFGNKSRGFARAIVEVGAAYDAKPEEVMDLLKREAAEWVAERKEVMLEDEPTVLAIMGFADSAVNYRVMIKTIPGEQFAAERALRVRIKNAFDAAGLEIPFPQRTLHVKQGTPAVPPSAADPLAKDDPTPA